MPFIRRPAYPERQIKSINDEAENMPSIRRQTPWTTGVFNFGLAQVPGVDYFNSGIVARADGLWLITRRCVWHHEIKIGINDLMAFQLDEKLIPVKGIKIDLRKRFHGEHFEDPRAIIHNGKVYVSCCDFVIERNGWTGAHQIICEVNNDWQTEKRWDPDYGKNGNDLGKNTGNEKNWLFFFRENKPFMVYGANPHVVVEFDQTFTVEREHVTVQPVIPWQHGEIRGGTPPVLVDDLYWTFFHSSVQWREDGKRWYVMGAYAFENKPPFAMKRITPKPLLCGSRMDRWAEGKPLVVFACGALFRAGKWLITGGLNDLDSFFVEIPHNELSDLTVEI